MATNTLNAKVPKDLPAKKPVKGGYSSYRLIFPTVRPSF
jgi:hypothetical protein